MYSFEGFEKELNKITPVKLISFTGVKNYTVYQCKKMLSTKITESKSGERKS